MRSRKNPTPSETDQPTEQLEPDELINESPENSIEQSTMEHPDKAKEEPTEEVQIESKLPTEPQTAQDTPYFIPNTPEITESSHTQSEIKTIEDFQIESDDSQIKHRPNNFWSISSLETLNKKLDQYPDLKEIEDFGEHYRRATIYFHIKDLREEYDPSSIPYSKLEELSHKTKIRTWTLRRWERNGNQPWLLHCANLREHSKYGKIEQKCYLDSFEEFQSLLTRHPHLEERLTFTEHYQRVKKYYKIQYLQKEGKLTNISTAALARKFEITWNTAHQWRNDENRPNLINIVIRHEFARVQHEAKLHLEAFYHRIPPEEVYTAFKHLRTHETPPATEIATTLEHLHSTNILSSPVLFFELFHYHEYGPTWLKRISQTIETHQHQLETHLNQYTNPNETLRIGVAQNQVYLWRRNTGKNEWLNLYRHEHFHFHTTHDKAKLIDTAHKHLALYNDQALSRLIGQITNYGGTIYKSNSISDLRRNTTIMEGEILLFLLSIVGADEKQVKPLIHHIGTETYPKSGRILNPKFPPIEPLRTQLFSTMISDGHLTKDRHLEYVEKQRERVERVKALISAFGEVEYNEIITPSGVTKLRLPAVFGRILEEWEFPIGDKAIRNSELPSYIIAAPQEIKCKYLQEMVPEDGSFTIDKRDNRGSFRIDRSMVLDAGNKNKAYQFKPKVDENDIHYIKQFGTLTRKAIVQKHSFDVYEMKWSRLVELSNSTSPDAAESASRLKTIIMEYPHRLLAGEVQLCRDLGIQMRENVVSLFYYPGSERVSVQRHAETSSNDDAIRWALLALPNDEIKSTIIEHWLSMQNESDIRRIQFQIDKKLFEN